jgi:formylglycine-generating enzyme required for sulfatase activity
LNLILVTAFMVSICGCGHSASPAASTSQSAVVPEAPKVEPLKLQRTTNSVDMELVQLPAGEFDMGAPDSDDLSNPDEKPVHRVKIKQPFWIGTHEVTVGQFRKFVEATNYKTAAEATGEGGFSYNSDTQRLEPDNTSSWRHTGFKQSDTHPVVNVNWDDAKAFCEWLSKTEKATYRLPTEVEWEYACRAGTTTRWPWGTEQECVEGMANVCDHSLRRAYPFAKWSMEWDDLYAFTAPVGTFPPNAFGLYDMQGNVFEWCADAWQATDYAGKPAPDEFVPDTTDMRHVRGGSYLSLIMFTRSSDRVGLKSKLRNAITGFRVVRDVTADAAPSGEKTHE